MDRPASLPPVTEPNFIAEQNRALAADLADDYAHLATQLARRGIDIERVTTEVMRFGVAIPSWGVGTGGTRFARFPGPGEPHDVFDKLQDCGVVHALTAATPTVSMHFPWDDTGDIAALRETAERFGLGFAAVNSNTFQDHPGDPRHRLSYRFGSLTHVDPAVRSQAVAHNIECIRLGEALGAKALTVWIGDGANFPGQQHTARAFERYIGAMGEIVGALPPDWSVFLEHKLYEPAFYATVIQDWGSSLLAAQALGPQARCLVDLGHHAPGVNIEMIVARLMHAGKLGGFHFNDSRYGDDDLDAGSIDPYRLFLIFNELVDNAGQGEPSYMLDQSHNVTDPIESLMTSAMEVQRAYARALLVDRATLAAFQAANDPLMASQTLRRAFATDVEPIVSMARSRRAAAIDPVSVYRASGYRAAVTNIRPARAGGGGGIV